MADLFLNFQLPDGGAKRVRVDRERFTIGRHSENDLAISDGRLSREHLRITRTGDAFYVSDLGSSNGTKLNGSPVDYQETLKNGDILDLGGLPITVELEKPAEKAAKPAPATAMPVAAGAVPSPATTVASDSVGSGIGIFVVAGVIAFGILAVGVIAFFAFSSSPRNPGDNVTSTNVDDDPPINRKEKNTVIASHETPSSGDNSKTTPGSTSTPGNSTLPPPTPATGAEKTELNAKKFLIAISREKRAFLSGENSQKVDSKVKQVSSSSAIAANINSARKNASRISAIANAKGLKPLMLATAAITKLGGSSGDVVQTAETMSDSLGKLRATIGDEFADDVLLVVAVYDRGSTGDASKLPLVLQRQFDAKGSVRSLRSIWNLQADGTITQSEFDFALQFLAVGTITQNPKDYNVNAEALTF